MDSKRDGGTALGRLAGDDLHYVTGASIRLGQFAHVASDDTEVGEVLLHPDNLVTDISVRLARRPSQTANLSTASEMDLMNAVLICRFRTEPPSQLCCWN